MEAPKHIKQLLTDTKKGDSNPLIVNFNTILTSMDTSSFRQKSVRPVAFHDT